MTKIQMRIMVRAATIRLARGETIEDILAGWPNLTEEDRTVIRKAVSE